MSAPSGVMRALILSKPAGASAPTLSLSTTHPVPSSIPAGHLLIKIHASAIQPSDLGNSRGAFPYTTFPRVPGRDFSGTVAGPPGHPRLGQAVFGSSGKTHAFTVDGFQAEYAVVPEAGAAPKPAALDFVDAATVGVPFTTALLAIRRARVKAGESVLVLGARGAVGSAACMLLEDRGCTVLRGVRGPAGDVDTDADPRLEAVAGLTHGRGVDAVIDTIGNPELTAAAVDNALADWGRCAFISAPKGTEPAKLAFAMQMFYRHEKELVGCNSISYSIEDMGSFLQEAGHVFATEAWSAAAKNARWTRVPLEQAVDAYQSQERGKKFVITVE